MIPPTILGATLHKGEEEINIWFLSIWLEGSGDMNTSTVLLVDRNPTVVESCASVWEITEEDDEVVECSRQGSWVNWLRMLADESWKCTYHDTESTNRRLIVFPGDE